MHRIAAEIRSVIAQANLTLSDFYNPTDRNAKGLDAIEEKVIALLAPLPQRERDEVMADLDDLE